MYFFTTIFIEVMKKVVYNINVRAFGNLAEYH